MNYFKLKSRLMLDSFLYSKQRKSASKNIFCVVISITLAVILSLIVATIIGYNPFTLIQQLFQNGFIDYQSLIVNIVVLGVGALAFSFAFKAGIFNLGMSGQMLGSGLTILVISTALQDVNFPNGSGQIFMLFISIIAGGFVACLIGLLKIYLNVNEVISAILLNWIIFFSTRLIIDNYYSVEGALLTQSFEIPEQFRFIAPGIGGWLPALIIFVILTIVILFITKFTVFGHKVQSVGFSKTASKYVGYNVNLIHIMTITISGAIAGIMGYILYTSGNTPSIPISQSVNALPEQGMNGIAIGLIAMNNPIAIAPVAFLLGLFSTSAPYLETPVAFNNLIIGLVILASAMFVILLNYKPWIYIKKKMYGLYAENYYNSYENELEALISKYYFLVNKKIGNYLILRQFTRAENELFKKYTSMINDKNLSIEQKNHANKMLNWLLSSIEQDCQKTQFKNKSIYDAYLEERQNYIGQYKKHILILKATQIFFPEVEAKNVINIKNYICDIKYIKVKSKKQEKIAHLEEKISENSNNSQKYNSKIKELLKSIEKDTKQNEEWKYKNSSRITKYYILKSKMHSNKEKIRDKYINKAKKLNIGEEQQTLLINWINDSYNESMQKEGGK